MCIVCVANNINRNVYMYLNIRIFPTSGYARVLLFMFIRRELGGTGTGCLFQFTYCDYEYSFHYANNMHNLVKGGSIGPVNKKKRRKGDYYLIHQFKHVFWVLKRTVSLSTQTICLG